MNPYYQDDAITLYHADCREIDLPTASVDLLVADPPYGMGYRNTAGVGIAGDDSGEWVKGALVHCLRALKINRHFYIFGPHHDGLTTAHTAELVWDKGRMGGLGAAGGIWSAGHERITFGVYSRFASHSGVGAGLVRLRRSSVISVPKTNNGRGAGRHPNEKPVGLLRVLIEASSHFGETVFDPFAGSGSTLVAARMEGRRAVGVEKEERFCEMAADRLREGLL